MGAQLSQAGAPLGMRAHPSQAGAQYVAGAQPVAQVGALFAVCAQLATPAGTQPGALAADWDKEDANALLKLARGARFCESAGNKIRGFVADLELYLLMCARPVYHWGYFLMASLGAEEAEKVRRSYLTDVIEDYAKFKDRVKALFGKFEFEGSYRAQLRTHALSGAESIAAYAARTTDVCSKAYPAFVTKTQLSLAVDHFITGLGDITTRDYLLHDCACRSLSWQEVVQMAQACKASRLLLHAPAAAAETTRAKVVAPAPATATSACAHDDITASPAWQSKSARDGRAKRGAHSSRKDDQQTCASAARTSHPQQNAPHSVAHEPPPHSNSENSTRAPAEQVKSAAKPRAITCYLCGKISHVASACSPDARPPCKCYACGGVGHMARDCPTRAAQAKAQISNSSSNAVASAGKGAEQVFAPASIAGLRITDALIETGLAFSMVSSAMYARLRDAPVIQSFTRAAPDVVGVGGASAEIGGYVDAPFEVAGVREHHLLLVVEGLAFSLLIGTDNFCAHGAVLTLDETAPVRLQSRECSICREQRTDSPAALPLAPLTACAACNVVIEPCTAAFIRVCAPTALCKESNVAVEALASLLDKHGCAALPSVYVLSSSEFFVPLANPLNNPIEILAGTPVAAIASDALAANSLSIAATKPQLSRNEKFRKILRELQVDGLPTRHLTNARSSRSSVSTSISSPKATRMWARQVSRFRRSIR